MSHRGSWSAAAAPAAIAVAIALAAGCAAVPPPCPVAAPGPPHGAALLWRIERSDGRAVWLFGTIHDAGADDVPAAVWHQLAAASVFVSELGSDEPDPLQLTALARLPWGRVLDQMLPADDWWELVEAMLGAMTEDELRHARPWYALVRLRAHAARSPRPSMDVAMAERATARGIAVERLESWRDQLAALDASVDAADLAQAIHERKAVACQVARLRAAYRASDLPALTRMLLDPVRGDQLLAERNRRWLPQIERYLDRGGGFVAVGLGHLLGDAGLPAMLERAGYRVTRDAVP
ncbi:MAG TPA: TraB/GumN family protein [Kofleriaceae bacterium]|nr:TraB/GumN family protein [Kofleriaceae bacterium]